MGRLDKQFISLRRGLRVPYGKGVLLGDGSCTRTAEVSSRSLGSRMVEPSLTWLYSRRDGKLENPDALDTVRWISFLIIIFAHWFN